MGYISDDQVGVTVEVLQPGLANILEDSIVAPDYVQEDEPFTIEVTINNTGELATIYAQLLDEMGEVIPGTLQEEVLEEDEDWVVTFSLPGQTGDEFICTIDAGHKTDD